MNIMIVYDYILLYITVLYMSIIYEYYISIVHNCFDYYDYSDYHDSYDYDIMIGITV